MIDQPVIQLRDVRKRYGDFTAVNGINLDVRAGEIFGILGPNGAGKTTTLEMIEGLRAPDSGSITVAGFDAVRQNDEVRKIIGVQLQSTSLFPFLSARELLELFGHLYGIADPAGRAVELLASVNLTDKGHSRMEQLSGGQQQRLSIALALVNSPVVSFLDEPTTGLDPHARRNLWQTILDVRAGGSTVVLTTHYMDEAEQLCDRIAIMDGGNVIACDTPAALIRSLPQDAVVKATSLQPLSWTTRQLQTLPGATTADITTSDIGSSLAIGTADVQATIVALLNLADAHAVRLDNLASSSASLEDVFLALTGRTYADPDDATVAGGVA